MSTHVSHSFRSPKRFQMIAHVVIVLDVVRPFTYRFDSSPLATTVIRIAAVVVVLGDISLTAGASHAAMSQTPLTEVLRNGEALLNR